MKSDRDAEAALPPGVAKGLRLDTTPEEQQLQAGGIGPGGQVGPDPATRRLEEGRTYANEDTPGQEGPISESSVTARPTRPDGDVGPAATVVSAPPQRRDA